MAERRTVKLLAKFAIALQILLLTSMLLPSQQPRAATEQIVRDFHVRISQPGFGDRQNSFAWSMQWWNGRLYVGTGRSFVCVVIATADLELGTNLFRPRYPDVECARTPQDLNLQAEIWRYTPHTRTWGRVFQSPNNVRIPGHPTKFVAPDIGFRSMMVYQEPDGTEALYVAGISSRSLNPGVPAPRILRSVDGVNFTPIPQASGTFLHELPVETGLAANRSFRSMTSYNGRFYVTVADLRGVGVLLESSNPKEGNDSFRQVTPSDMKVWQTAVYNGYLYLGLEHEDGYAVVKTDATGEPPYEFTPVVINGGFKQAPRSSNVLSMHVYDGLLYVGTDRPTELIRIYPNDTWEVVVGEPRNTPRGLKEPISGIPTGFGNPFNGHFWRMQQHQGRLYLGTWDYSVQLRTLPNLNPLIQEEFGFDLFATPDGIFWYPVTRDGFGNGFNYGARSMASTPRGLFVGTANPYYGAEVHQVIPRARQVFLPMTFAPGTTAVGGGVNAEGLSLQGLQPVEGFVRASDVPERLEAEHINNQVVLSWELPTGATEFRVFRKALLPEDAYQVQGAGALYYPFLEAEDPNLPDAIHVPELEAYEEIGVTSEPFFFDEIPEDGKRYIYYVVAQDGHGNASNPSNLIGVPFAKSPTTFGDVRGILSEWLDAGNTITPAQAELILGQLEQAENHLAARQPEQAQLALQALNERVLADSSLELERVYANRLELEVRRLLRRIGLAEEGIISAAAILEK